VKSGEQDILAAGAQIIWIMQDAQNFATPADGPASHTFYEDVVLSDAGLRVGDDTTLPINSAFEDETLNEFLRFRGSVIIVRKRDMQMFFGIDVDSGGDMPPPAIIEQINLIPE
jgi:hypothetical protein